MMKPMPAWASSLQKKIEDVMKDANSNGASSSQKKLIQAWQEFLDENVQGIMVSAPYSLSTGTANPKLFSPLPLEGKEKTPEQVAKKFADAWKAYVSGIQWAPPPPIPPFSTITAVITSPVGVNTAYAKMIPQFIAEFKKPPKKGQEVQKYQNLAKIFYEATISMGVQISGISLAGAPPPPLVLPQIPAM